DKAEINKHLGYAKTIKLTGRFPSRPKKMGTVKFDEFYDKALNDWNVNNDPQEKQYQEIVDMLLDKSEEEWTDIDIGKILYFLKEMVE
ncbi:MAG: hypothetical protein Q4B70_19515, partial [Lachnospiraceae bacterium]|nr:hypothetical protein [Lachnospiraceae bacterium]